MRLAINVAAMLIAVAGLVALLDWLLTLRAMTGGFIAAFLTGAVVGVLLS